MLSVMPSNGFAQLKSVKPTKKAKTRVVAACSREQDLNTSEKFFLYMTNGLTDGKSAVR